ncbi:MAG: hypothetical protein LLF76_07465 [Planctomycetaceae bacterium]|nr:hypothetical protein [Planctomycetaceae bacterium]
MKNVLYILVCLGMASWASALSINNGNFEKQSGTADAADVSNWYDYGGGSVSTLNAGPWFRGSGIGTINATGCLFMSGTAVTSSEDGGRKAWVYQGIGKADGTKAINISLQWGAASYVEDGNIGNGEGGVMGLTLMILESDGTFTAGEFARTNDIYGAAGITEITRATRVRDLAPGVAVNESFTLDISSATAGKELFLRINAYNAGVDPWMTIDNITMAASKIAPKAPKDNARFVAIERTSSANDLTFKITDPNNVVTSVDVLFGPENDPNLSLNPAYKIVSAKSVSNGNQYTITLNTELSTDLVNNKPYYWKVIPHDANSVTMSAWNFTTIPSGPYVDPVAPSVNAVYPGADAVFSVVSVNVDTYQWYKDADPDIALSSSDPHYSGVTTNTLTIHNAQVADEGSYYCIGTKTGGDMAQSLASGEVTVNRLMHHFPFNTAASGITLDTVGGVQAQLMGGAAVTSDANSIVGGYLNLSNPGSNLEDSQYANILDPSAFTQRQVTISAWYRMKTRSGKAPIWAVGADTNNYFDFFPQYQYSEDDGTGTARSEFRVSSNLRNITSGSYEIKTDQWYFVTITNNEGTEKLYLDGEYAATSDMFTMSEIQAKITELGTPLAYIGKRLAGAAGDYPLFNGYIDEVKVYNYAMSTIEVGQEYLSVKTDADYVCNQETYAVGDYDYDGNCQVDLGDFAEMAAKWLLDYQIF